MGNSHLKYDKYMNEEVQFIITIYLILFNVSHNKEMCRTHKHTTTVFTFSVIFINIHMNLRTDTGATAGLKQVATYIYLRFSPMVFYTFFFVLPSLVHRTYVSLISLVSFWIFVLVDMSTYLSPILTIMPPRIEESVCRKTIVRIRESFLKYRDFQNYEADVLVYKTNLKNVSN